MKLLIHLLPSTNTYVPEEDFAKLQRILEDHWALRKGRKVNMDLLTLLSRDEALENGVKPLPNNLIYFVTPNVHPKLRS